jgi:nucleoside-diphosphate-sugar epimerase
MESILGWMRETKIGAQNLLFTSSSSVYPQTDGGLVNEQSETKEASPRAQVLLEAERSCLNAPTALAFTRCVLRFSGLYGPGRHLLVDKIRRGEPMNGSPHRVLNLLHRDDAASSIQAFLQSAPTQEGGYVYNVCDGQHAKRGEIAEWVASRVGASVPAFIDADADKGANRRVDNTRICNDLKWSPKYPNFQSGYEDFLASE